MKSAVLCTVLAASSVFSLNAAAQTPCANGGGNQPGVGPVDPYAPISDVPYDLTGSPSAPLYPTAPSAQVPVSTNVAPQMAPKARITVVNAASERSSARPGSAPTARITVVASTPAATPKVDTTDVAKTVEQITEASKPADDTAASEEADSIDPALKGLVGTWMAVARHGDGELTTVELQLDDRGWAKLTVPGADGKPSSTKRRVKFEDEELKLSGPDAELSLGKLIDVNSRQMVLARSSGQITFVRP